MASASTKIILSVVSSLIAGIIGMIFITMNILPLWATTLVISLTIYIYSILISAIYQYSSCNTVNIKSILYSNIVVLLTNSFAMFILYLEGIPFLKQIFGEYPPRNPYDGLPYEVGTKPYIIGMENENHYKIQFFSSIVKAVIPMYIDDSMKNGFVYLYWIFWMTILPLFFLLSVQGMCTL